MKPEPPPYPRPVPNIDFDEDPILPGTVIYTKDDEIDEHQRAAKRRRIEANANAYLRGEGLFILSAGLRGPFDAGWKNPWAAKGRKRTVGIDDQSCPNKRARVSASNPTFVQVVNKTANSSRHQPSLSVQENPFARTIRSSEPPSHDEKVESWLRRNDALPHDSFVVPTSPTPKKRSSVAGSGKAIKPTWTPTKQRITVNSQDIRAPLHHVSTRVPDSFDTVVPPGRHPAESHEKLQSVLHAPNPEFSHSAGFVNGAGDQPVRAEQAILKLKRKSEEPAHKDEDAVAQIREASRGEDGHQSPIRESDHLGKRSASVEQPVHVAKDSPTPMPDKPATHPEVKLKELDNSINKQLQGNKQEGKVDHPNEAEHPTDSKMDARLPSTAISEVQIVKLPPSAQPKPELQTSASNMSSAALLPDMPNDKKIATLNTVQSNLSEQVVNNTLTSAASQCGHSTKASAQNASQQEVIEPGLGVLRARSKSPLPQGGAVVVQQIHRSPMREVNAKTSQTSLDGSIVRPPAQVQKAKSTKKTKKASFAAETSFASSHGSIKSVLKVQKRDVFDRAQKDTPPGLSFSKPIDMDTSPDEEARSPRPNASAEVPKVPRSILRTRSTHSSPAAALASVMLSPRNRQGSSMSRMSNLDLRASGQNGMLERQRAEEFEMNGAMDDLGSFLSTWNDQKESIRAMQ